MPRFQILVSFWILPLVHPKKHVFFEKSADRYKNRRKDSPICQKCVDWTCGVYEGYFRCIQHCLGRGITPVSRPKNKFLNKKKGEIRRKKKTRYASI